MPQKAGLKVPEHTGVAKPPQPGGTGSLTASWRTWAGCKVVPTEEQIQFDGVSCCAEMKVFSPVCVSRIHRNQVSRWILCREASSGQYQHPQNWCLQKNRYSRQLGINSLVVCVFIWVYPGIRPGHPLLSSSLLSTGSDMLEASLQYRWTLHWWCCEFKM